MIAQRMISFEKDSFMSWYFWYKHYSENSQHLSISSYFYPHFKIFQSAIKGNFLGCILQIHPLTRPDTIALMISLAYLFSLYPSDLTAVRIAIPILTTTEAEYKQNRRKIIHIKIHPYLSFHLLSFDWAVDNVFS